jgi:hypothetical protein
VRVDVGTEETEQFAPFMVHSKEAGDAHGDDGKLRGQLHHRILQKAARIGVANQLPIEAGRRDTTGGSFQRKSGKQGKIVGLDEESGSGYTKARAEGRGSKAEQDVEWIFVADEIERGHVTPPGGKHR